MQGKDVQLRPFDHLVSAAEAGALVRTITLILVSFCDFVGDDVNKICYNIVRPLLACLTWHFFSDYQHVLVLFVHLNCLSLKHYLFVDRGIFLVFVQVCLFTNPIWLVKTRMQLQTPGHTSRYSGFSGNICCHKISFLNIIYQCLS